VGVSFASRGRLVLVLVEDNGPIHTSKRSLAALAARAHWLTVEWLPKYAPELNEIEPVWRDLKAHHLAHQTFTDVKPSTKPSMTPSSISTASASPIRWPCQESLLSHRYRAQLHPRRIARSLLHLSSINAPPQSGEGIADGLAALHCRVLGWCREFRLVNVRRLSRPSSQRWTIRSACSTFALSRGFLLFGRRKCARRQKAPNESIWLRIVVRRTLRSTRGAGQSESKGSGSTTRMLPRRRMMYGQVIFRRRPDPSLKAAEVSFRLASGAKWRLAERRVAMVRLLVKVRHQQWVRAESAKAYRPPTLLEDNPTSG
jgi:hypothetical protein